MATSSDLDSDFNPACDAFGPVHTGSHSKWAFEPLDGQCLRSLLDWVVGRSMVVGCQSGSVVRAVAWIGGFDRRDRSGASGVSRVDAGCVADCHDHSDGDRRFWNWLYSFWPEAHA